ncbi:MAG: metallophosphoesterase family protein [Acidobacteriota bacterium]|nr:metallophosphoesterase family protein [Acidobacteriota bacterium]
MRLLLLSDIHANLEALEACLDAAPEYDAVACLGDVVGYGGSPNQTLDLVRAINPILVRGNHDRACSGLENTDRFNPVAAAAALWTQQQLSDRNLDWLRALPKGPVRHERWKNACFVHGSPVHEDAYITSNGAAGEALQQEEAAFTFFGHTHVQGAFAWSNGKAEAVTAEPMRTASRLHATRIKLAPEKRYLFNPGSVGQPRDLDRRAAFALYDTVKHEVRFYRTPYDIKRAQQRILEAGLPKALAFRLEEGR